MSTEEEEEFEDALDSLPALPTQLEMRSPSRRLHLEGGSPAAAGSSSSHLLTPTTSSAAAVDATATFPTTPLMPPPPPPLISPRPRPETIAGLSSTPVGTAAAAVPMDATMSARQERLANLRRRLRDEFGHSTRGGRPLSTSSSTGVGGNFDGADSLSLASDSTSLHSWHHSLLQQAGGGAEGGGACSVVRAADSMSTCAATPLGETGSSRWASSPSSPPPAMPPPPRLTTPVRGGGGAVPPPLPPRPGSIRLPDPVAAEVLKRIAEAEAAKRAELEGEGDESRGEIEETMILRNDSTLTAAANSSAASSADLFLSPATSFHNSSIPPADSSSPYTTAPSDSPRAGARGRSKSTREEQAERKSSERLTEGASVESLQQASCSNTTNSSGATLADSSYTKNAAAPATVQPPQQLSSERRRGHAKTNSLDRGLTLAKSIKSGPFPPPSSKSNSLTRGQAAPDFDGEEEERNSMAGRVIQQLTTSVIGEGAMVVVGDDSERRRPSQLGAIPSCSSSSPSSSAASSVSSRGGRGRKDQLQPEKNGAAAARRKDERARKKDALSVVKESPEHAGGTPPPLGELSPRSPQDATVSPSAMAPGSSRSLPSQDRTLGARLSDWATLGGGEKSPDASYDPITRDVERRMSMKGHGQLGGSGGGLDGGGREDEDADAVSVAGSAISNASTAVRGLASGLFRGMMSRARSALHTTAAPFSSSAARAAAAAAAADSELSDSDSDADDPLDSGSVVGGASGRGVAGRQSVSSSSTSAATSSSAASASIVRPRNAKKGPFDFAELKVVQEITNEHTGAVWCVKFSICGRLMATAGHDTIIRVWCVRSAQRYFNDMREKYQQKRGSTASSTNTSFDGGVGGGGAFDRTMADLESDLASSYKPASSDAGDSLEGGGGSSGEGGSGEEGSSALFATKPFAVFKGHTADVLDLSWSKNYFVLSSGMDRTVKLWHLSRSECLCCFQHVDFVTCVSFLPKDDRYFLSGSLDGKLRMWHIPDKKVAVWNEVAVKFITALAFAKSGKFAVVGTYNGKCYFYSTDQLKYHTVVDVRSTRGKNARGHKVTGLAVHGDKLLVTSNDSRVRMYDVRDKALTCKFKGVQNERSQIRAHFSPDGKHIVCGSEDRYVYIWRTSDLPSSLSVRKDRNAQWERARAHTQPVSVACFAPKPQVFLAVLARAEAAATRRKGQHTTEAAAYRGSAAAWAADAAAAAAPPPQGDVIISADLSGCIKIMVNRAKPVKLGKSTFFPSS